MEDGLGRFTDRFFGELEISERRFRTLMEQSPAAIHIFSPDGLSIRSNGAWDRLWGVENEPPEGTNIFDDLYLKQTGLIPYIEQSFLERAPVYSPPLAYVHAGTHGAWHEERASAEESRVEYPWLEAYIYPVIGEAGSITEAVMVLEDVTERELNRRELEYQARHDSLTGLLNRAAFIEALGEALNDALYETLGSALGSTPYPPDTAGTVAVLFLDVDGLKAVNDTLGHRMGDELLKAVAGRLRGSLRPDEAVARLGGDEFAVMICSSAARIGEEAETVARRLIAALEAPYELSGREVFASASAGIADSTATVTAAATTADMEQIRPAQGRSSGGHDRASVEPDHSPPEQEPEQEPGSREMAENLLGRADLALHRAKAAGKGGYEVYDDEMAASTRDRLELENDLRRLLRREDPWDELCLYYQPLVNTEHATGNMPTSTESSGEGPVSTEALLRWRHPQRGLLSPGEFLSIAEESGLIVELGRQVLLKALTSSSSGRSKLNGRVGVGETEPGEVNGGAEEGEYGGEDESYELCVNLSATQLRDPNLVGDVKRVLERSGFAAGRLVLELTESALLAEVAIPKLRELRALGVRVAVDDFGTGYSSLSYLQDLPVDRLKIDRSFVAGMGERGESTRVLAAILELARAFSLEVVAEGVETAEQLTRLRELGCEMVQGYYLGRPVPEV